VTFRATLLYVTCPVVTTELQHMRGQTTVVPNRDHARQVLTGPQRLHAGPRLRLTKSQQRAGTYEPAERPAGQPVPPRRPAGSGHAAVGCVFCGLWAVTLVRPGELWRPCILPGATASCGHEHVSALTCARLLGSGSVAGGVHGRRHGAGVAERAVAHRRPVPRGCARAVLWRHADGCLSRCVFEQPRWRVRLLCEHEARRTWTPVAR